MIKTFKDIQVETIELEKYGNFHDYLTIDTLHSLRVASAAAGILGVCKSATLINTNIRTKGNWASGPSVAKLVRFEGLLAIANDIAVKKRNGKAVVNISWALRDTKDEVVYRIYRE